MFKYICDGTKYRYGGKRDSINLPVNISGLPSEVTVEGVTLSLKSTFHVTLVCVDIILEKYSIQIPYFAEKIINDFCVFVRDNNIDLVKYRDEFMFVTEDNLQSVIVMCDVSNLDTFFKQMNAKYNLALETPPTHVTLYSLPTDTGIFVLESHDIKKLTEPIPNPGIALLTP